MDNNYCDPHYRMLFCDQGGVEKQAPFKDAHHIKVATFKREHTIDSLDILMNYDTPSVVSDENFYKFNPARINIFFFYHRMEYTVLPLYWCIPCSPGSLIRVSVQLSTF